MQALIPAYQKPTNTRIKNNEKKRRI